MIDDGLADSLAADGSWAARQIRAEAASRASAAEAQKRELEQTTAVLRASRKVSTADAHSAPVTLHEVDADKLLLTNPQTPRHFHRFEADDAITLDAAPVDRCCFTYASFMTLGIGLLMPWSAVVQSAALFVSSAMFGSCSNIIVVMSAANMASILFVMLIMVYVNGRWQCNGRALVAFGFVCRTICIAILAVGGTELSYEACVAVIIIDGLGGGFSQSALFGLSAMLPPRFMSATMFGTGISGKPFRCSCSHSMQVMCALSCWQVERLCGCCCCCCCCCLWLCFCLKGW